MRRLADEQLRWELKDVTELHLDSHFDAIVEKGCRRPQATHLG